MRKIGVAEKLLLGCIDEFEGVCFELLQENCAYDAIITGLDTKITKKMWENYGSPTILSPTTNISYIPEELWERVIKIDPSEILGVSATAEHAFCLLLMACRKMGNHVLLTREDWLGRQLAGMNIAIFGYGRIGKLLEKYCNAFSMNIKSFDKENNNKDKIALFNWADAIFVSITYDKTTECFFNMSHINDFKENQIIINTSRAQIIEKQLLLNCIDRGIWNYVCLDFINYEDRPYYFDPEFIRRRDKMIITPHIAGNTKDSLKIAINIVIKKFLKRKK